MLSISTTKKDRDGTPHSAPNLKAEAIAGALFCSLKGQEDRFAHSCLCRSDSLAFKDDLSARFGANTTAPVKILQWWLLLCLLRLGRAVCLQGLQSH